MPISITEFMTLLFDLSNGRIIRDERQKKRQIEMLSKKLFGT